MRPSMQLSPARGRLLRQRVGVVDVVDAAYPREGTVTFLLMYTLFCFVADAA